MRGRRRPALSKVEGISRVLPNTTLDEGKAAPRSASQPKGTEQFSPEPALSAVEGA
jgi:hypothetical protein